MERSDEEKAGAQESSRGGAGPFGRLGAQRSQTAREQENGRKGGLVKSRKKTIAVRRNARRPRPGRRKKV
jgi:hypothetical protein